MNPEHISKSIAALVAKGFMTREAILKTLTERMEDFICLSNDEELPQLRKTFNSLCIDGNRTRKITQSAFVSYLQTAGFLPPSMTELGALTYRILLYLSQAPFYDSSVKSLTQDGLFRALVLTDSERSRRAYEESSDTRSRAPADTQRLLFQSLATTRDGKALPVDTYYARKQAERRAFDFSGVLQPEMRREYAQTNYDDGGDEMFHDLLDTLYNIGVQRTPGWLACVPRTGFRTLAKELRGGMEDQLRHLSIPRDDYRAFVKLLLIAHVGRPLVQKEYFEELDQISECIVRGFAQIPNLGVTFDMFEQATYKTPALFVGFHRLLSIFYTPLEKIDFQHYPTEPGRIATRPILSQLGLIVSETVSFDYFQLHKDYDITKSVKSIDAASIAEDIAAVPDPVIVLLISGKLIQTNERTVLGYYLPWAGRGEDIPDPCLLFQLSPVHDVFRGDNTSRPGWDIGSDQSLTFGKRDEGVSLVLEKNCKRATLTHHVSGNGFYKATAWRGDWEVDVQVEGVEMWIEV